MLLDVHTYVGPRSVQNAIKMDERNENVIDGIIKMYLKMHHIDFFYEVFQGENYMVEKIIFALLRKF